MIRRVDDLGRVVLPKDIRRELSIREGTEINIEVSEGKILMTKYNRTENVKHNLKSTREMIAELVTNSELEFIDEHLQKISDILESKQNNI